MTQKHVTQRSATQMIGEVRIVFPFHFEKRTKSPGGMVLTTPRHDAVLLVPKLGPAETCSNYAKLSTMAMEAASKAWQAWPEGGNWPIEDGDIPYKSKPKPGETPLSPAQLAERNKWRIGSWVVEVTNYLQGAKISVLQNGVLQDIPAQTVAGVQLFKSGDYGYVSMNAYTYHHESGKFGVNFSYEGVAYTRPGELVGTGPKSTTQMFAGIPQGAPGMAAAAPGPASAPLPPMFPAFTVAAPPLVPAAPAPGAPPMPPMPPMPSAVPPLPR